MWCHAVAVLFTPLQFEVAFDHVLGEHATLDQDAWSLARLSMASCNDPHTVDTLASSAGGTSTLYLSCYFEGDEALALTNLS
jgi:hypothetical protein